MASPYEKDRKYAKSATGAYGLNERTNARESTPGTKRPLGKASPSDTIGPDMARGSKRTVYSKDAAAPEEKTFGKAFANARRAGKKTFTWKGKEYGTDLAEDTPKTSEGVEYDPTNYKCGGKTKKYARGGGIELRGKTKGRII